MRNTNIKKFITVLVLAVLAFVVVGCGKKEAKNNPMVDNADSTYVSIQENGQTYSVKKGKVYNELKSKLGFNTLMNLVVTDLLKDTDFYKNVTDEEVKAKIDEAIYGVDGAEGLSDEERQEKVDAFLDSIFETNGINTDDVYNQAVKDVYKLDLAKKAYAASKLDEEIAEHTKAYEEWVANGSDLDDEDAVKNPYFSEGDYIAEYGKENVNKFEAVLVAFASNREYQLAMAKQGVTVENNVWKKNGTELTSAEVKAVFEELYKAQNSKATLAEDEFTYTESELSAVSSTVASLVKDSYKVNEYSATPVVVSNGSLHVLVLKLSEELATPYTDLDETSKAKADEAALKSLKEQKLTSSYIANKVYALVASKDIVIYDSVLSLGFESVAANLGYEETKKESAKVVAECDGKEYTAEQLFKAMDKISGVTIALSELTYERFLNNPEINKYYDLASKTWKDDKVKKAVLDEVETEKENYENGTYIEYGYDPKEISWKGFMKEVYSVDSEDELMLLFLYGEVVAKYSEGLLNIADEENNPTKVWELVNSKMQEKVDEYFSVKGVHLLVSVYDNKFDQINGKNLLKPEEWTEEQKALASKLISEVKEFLADSKGTNQDKLQRVEKAFKECPTIPADDLSTKLFSDGSKVVIDVAAYKSQGLVVKYEALGSFANGSMVEAFNDAVKAIWDQDIKDNETKRTTISNEIVTEYGYHLYVNLASNKITTFSAKDEKDVTRDYVLPRLTEVLSYNKDADSLKSGAKTAVTTYYSPIAKEITGSYLTYVLQYTALNEVLDTVTVASENYTKADLAKSIQINVDKWYENNLTYITAEDLEIFK